MSVLVLRHVPSGAIQAVFTSPKKARKYLRRMKHVKHVVSIPKSKARRRGFLVEWDNGTVWELELVKAAFDPK
jgi:hypothetical protein